jgi:dihydrodipicolinate synthase/N-acetylneuraminate lyase
MVPSEQDVLNHFRDINDTADIGSMAYNIPWAMPDRGFDLTSRVLERFCELPNAVGVKWSSNNIYHYLRMLRWFGHRLKFIDNMIILSPGMCFGAKGFIDWYANAMPGLCLKFWELLRSERYDEHDRLYMKPTFDPQLATVHPEQQSYEDATWQSSKDIGILEYVEWSPDMIGGPVRRVER